MIVVTGASGFIGSRLVMALQGAGRGPILAVDDYARPGGGDWDGVADVPRYRDRLMVAAFLDYRELPAWLERNGRNVTGVVHLGACSDTTVTDRAYVMSVNFEYTRRLWRWCSAEGKPLVYASSAATYGDGALGYDDQCDPSRYRPLNLYGESKHLFDLWALEQQHSPPRWAGVKYFNVYGPHEEHKGRMASVVFHGFHQVRTQGRIRLFRSHRPGIPDGGQSRDFVYVDDAVAATIHLLRTPACEEAPNGLYNVGTGTARTFYDLAQAVFRSMHRSPMIEFVLMPEDLRDRYQYFTQADVTKLRRSGFSLPFRSLEQGVDVYVRQYLMREARAA